MSNSGGNPPGDVSHLVQLDPDLKDLVPAYLDRRQQDLTNLGRALGQGDFAVIATIGHRLRGNAATFGFLVLESVGQALEEAAHREDADAVREAIARMDGFLRRLQIHYT